MYMAQVEHHLVNQKQGLICSPFVYDHYFYWKYTFRIFYTSEQILKGVDFIK